MNIFRSLWTGTKPRRHPQAAVMAAMSVALPTLLVGFGLLITVAPVNNQAPPDIQRIGLSKLYYYIGNERTNHSLFLRFEAALFAALCAGALSGRQTWRRTPLGEPFTMPHADDARLHYGSDADQALTRELAETYGVHAKKGIRLSPGVTLPFEAENQFMLVVGDKGSGKSNIVRALASQMIERGDLTLLHCVKGDVTRSFRPQERVLIAAHHAESWAWDVGSDIVGLAGFMELAAAVIPMSDSPFWAQTARAVFVDIARELAADQGRNWEFNALTRRILDDPEKIEARIRKLDLSASPLIAAGPDGLSNTAFSVLATLWSGALASLRPLAFAWAKTRRDRRFSVKAWLSPVWSGPRIVIVQTSSEYAEISRLVSSVFLGRIASLLSDPSLAIDPSRRVSLVFDEMHALGAIEGFERVLALGREKGLVVLGAIQGFPQLRAVYGSDRGAIIQDLFRYRIISSLASGESSDTALKLIGERTINFLEKNETPEKGDSRKWIMRSEKRPIVSASTLQGGLGVKVRQDAGNSGEQEIRAVVTGLTDVHRIDWPITRWPQLREGYVPATWMDAYYSNPEKPMKT